MSEIEIGRAIRAVRKQQGLRQAELAGLVGVGTRFVSDLESGKPTVELGRALQVLSALGLVVDLRQRRWSDLT